MWKLKPLAKRRTAARKEKRAMRRFMRTTNLRAPKRAPIHIPRPYVLPFGDPSGLGFIAALAAASMGRKRR